MNITGNRWMYSATDLVGFLECSHLTSLNRAAVAGQIQMPMGEDPVLDHIAERGKLHEQRFLESLSAEGLPVVKVGGDDDAGRFRPDRLARGKEETLAAMRAGADVIYQAVLIDERRLGFADFLRRVDGPSDLGEWSYEVWDTKLARQAKASAVLQLCVYSDLLAGYQGREPEEMHLALGGVMQEKVSFRFADYGAYYRMVARELVSALDQPDVYPLPTEPVPTEHCDVCRWSQRCKAQWRAQDDLSLVAGLTSRQRTALLDVGISTRTALGEPSPALPERVDGIGRDALQKVQAQASIQVRGDQAGMMLSERIAPGRDRESNLIPNQGLLMLPEPSPGDLFFDIEGDPFFGSDEVDGIDYLFGVIEPGRPDDAGNPAFHAFWSIENGMVTTGAERRAFEGFIDLVMDRLAADPGLHIYHYAPYEPTAVKRLAGRYGTREAEVDQLLRGGVFVDLYRAVRQGIRASVESYSIKRLEPLYGYQREANLRDAGDSIVEFEAWLELGQDEPQHAELLDLIAQYNRDDCLSTLHLREWLEGQRSALSDEMGGGLPRPAVVASEEREDSEAQQAVNELVDALIADLPDSVEEMDGEQRGQWLLAQLLNWHRREHKSAWWRYFYLMNELTDVERFEERDAMAGLAFESSWPDPAPRARSTIYRFRFPAQEHGIRVGYNPVDPETGRPVGSVFELDDEQGFIDIRLGSTRPAPTATSLIPLDIVQPSPKPQTLQRIAEWTLENGIAGSGEFAVARDLLARRLPKFIGSSGSLLLHEGEAVGDAARRLVKSIDGSYLAIQGPPGSGKSTVGAEMIVDLVEEGKKVGVTANSHKVIGELLAKVADVAEVCGVDVKIGQVPASGDKPTFADAIELTSNNSDEHIEAGSVHVVGGTTWLWAREDMTASVDVLFIDEAGQMSLADAVAASPSAANLVLLGDPQQLDQPLQGIHPPGADRSVLAHVLGDARVMPGDYGLFLDGSWRLHPSISAYTSEVFYDGRLRSHDGRDRLDLTGVGVLSGTGLRFLPADHSGHTSEAPEEVAAVAQLVRNLLESRATYTDADGIVHRLDDQDVLVISPYNLQVNALIRELPQYRIGTVDKFQGQEAPISIYSMATSAGEQAPHGMEFLYSLNRLNVATSRAQCLALVVASPGLLKVRCRTPRQMRLANALARLVELAGEGA